MSDIDEKILAAIRTETEKSLDDYSEELGPIGLAIESFKGASMDSGDRISIDTRFHRCWRLLWHKFLVRH